MRMDGTPFELKGVSWFVFSNPTDGTGVVDLSYADDAGKTCTMTGDIEFIEELDTCADCNLAMSVRFVGLSIVTDGGACDSEEATEVLALDGAEIAYGQGTPSLGEYHGVEYYSLWTETDGGWELIPSGYSSLTGDEDAPDWDFGLKGG